LSSRRGGVRTAAEQQRIANSGAAKTIAGVAGAAGCTGACRQCGPVQGAWRAGTSLSAVRSFLNNSELPGSAAGWIAGCVNQSPQDALAAVFPATKCSATICSTASNKVRVDTIGESGQGDGTGEEEPEVSPVYEIRHVFRLVLWPKTVNQMLSGGHGKPGLKHEVFADSTSFLRRDVDKNTCISLCTEYPIG